LLFGGREAASFRIIGAIRALALAYSANSAILDIPDRIGGVKVTAGVTVECPLKKRDGAPPVAGGAP
jgi:hypothetical protein